MAEAKGMVDMIMSPEEQKSSGYAMPAIAAEPAKPQYPYCLQISFDEEIMEKLGIDEMPTVGDMLKFSAESIVTGTNTSATGDEESRRINIQITHIDIGGEAKPKTSERLYNGREDGEE